MKPEYAPYQVHEDKRGAHSKFFMESKDAPGLFNFPIREVFMTTNRKGTIRGMHLQIFNAGAKLISCLTGSAYVQIVDLDPESRTFGDVVLQHELTPGEKIRVPVAHALGYRSLEDDTRILYLTDQEHDAERDVGFNPLSLSWERHPGDLFPLVLSDRDSALPSLEQVVTTISTQLDPVEYMKGGIR